MSATSGGAAPASEGVLNQYDLKDFSLREQAHYWLYGELPDGRRVHGPWTRPHNTLRHYIRVLEARLDAETPT